MKINILYEFKNTPWGGGNQFLKALKKAFIRLEVYERLPEKSDFVIFNSHHLGENFETLSYLHSLRLRNPKVRVIHRVDGPIQLYRGRDAGIDKLIFRVNNLLADATVFQTNWSMQKTLELGLTPTGDTSVIINAPDPQIFFRKHEPKSGQKTSIIATSFSSNERKGFDTYRYLDQNLDFSNYHMTFVGNTPQAFNNISHVGPVKSYVLAKMLRKHDLFLTASQHDPCSNSLIEALHSGLPALVRNSGGHAEVIGSGGVLFNGCEDVLEKLHEIAANRRFYANNIEVKPIKDIAQQYITFLDSVSRKNMHATTLNIQMVRALYDLTSFVSRCRDSLKHRVRRFYE